MQITMLYWHWLVLGLVLMMAEIFLPSFTILWFGAGAVLVGVILWLVPALSLTWQVFLWCVFSLVLALLWFKYLKPLAVDKTKAGLSYESIINETGMVLKVPGDDNRGLLRFPAPILGNDEWVFICTQTLQPGERVRVTGVSGNSLIVEKA